jgi:hypothetical protein
MRAIVAAALLLLLALASGAAVAGAARGGTSVYELANSRLARAIPHFPQARLLTEERVAGDAGAGAFRAVQRVYSLSPRQAQDTVTRFYARKLGRNWERRGAACHVSGSRLVVALVHADGRRLGVLIDSRGAASCAEERRLVRHLLKVGAGG